jgi:hypothetical protein
MKKYNYHIISKQKYQYKNIMINFGYYELETLKYFGYNIDKEINRKIYKVYLKRKQIIKHFLYE